MKLLEEVKYFRKELVHESYASIVENFKDYEKVSKVQMIKEIFMFIVTMKILLIFVLIEN